MRRGGAADIITEECERLFCETLKAVFLGERRSAIGRSVVMGPHKEMQSHDFIENSNLVTHWLEIWDYSSDVRLRGFVGSAGMERSLFVFFETNVLGKDLKSAYVH